MALLASGLETSFADDDWRRNEPPEMPPMTVNQALQLMYLHQKEARLGRTPDPMRRRRGETSGAVSMRLGLLYEARLERDRQAFRIAEAERLAEGKPTYQRWGPGELPDLAQVTGWSRATGKPATDPNRALFGGWRLGEGMPT